MVQLDIKDQIATLKLGSEEKYLTLTRERMQQLHKVLLDLRARSDLKGLVILGPTPEAFCVGADVDEISAINTFEEAFNASQEGQRIFKILADLPFVTVSAISGPAVGGGYELALCCDYRIASGTATVGLPEVKLGIIPGFGGTQRLPRLIGVFKSLEVICSGKIYKASEALKLGLVDLVVPVENLEAVAIKWAREKQKRGFNWIWVRDFTFLNIPFARKLALAGVSYQMSKKLKINKEHYQAPYLAAQAAIRSTDFLNDGYSLESELLAKSLISKTAKNLVYVWISSEKQKKLAKSFQTKAEAIRNVAILGAGVMGTGIAGLFASKGYQTVVYDVDDKALARSLQFLQNLKVEKLPVFTNNLNNIANSDLLIEAVVEDIKVKSELLKQASTIVSSNCIIATNTSSIPISELAGSVILSGRFLGMHFFNPVARMPIVEIVRGNDSSDQTVMIVMALATLVGKIPIVVEDSPGFLINRLLARYLIKAVRLANEGYSISSIERSAEEFGFPMGPFRLLDYVGIDIAINVGNILHQAFGGRYMPSEKMYRYIEEGYFGVKKGKGFYLYDNGKPVKLSDQTNLLFTPSKSLNKTDFIKSLIYPLVDETFFALESKIAGLPSPEAQAQIDLGSIFGFGFPAYTGGLIRFGLELDKREVHDSLLGSDEIVSSYFRGV